MKRLGRRFLSFLLMLSMVVSLTPGMALMSYAEEGGTQTALQCVLDPAELTLGSEDQTVKMTVRVDPAVSAADFLFNIVCPEGFQVTEIADKTGAVYTEDGGGSFEISDEKDSVVWFGDNLQDVSLTDLAEVTFTATDAAAGTAQFGVRAFQMANAAEQDLDVPAEAGAELTIKEAVVPRAPYEITTAAELQLLAGEVNAGEKKTGETYRLMNDIDLGSIENWTPIGGETEAVNLSISSQADLDAALEEHFIIYDSVGGSYVRGSDKNEAFAEGRTYYYQNGAAFDGMFDGQGYTVSNMTVNSTGGYAGLFGNVSGTVKNLTVSGAVTEASNKDFVGGIAGKLSAGGTIEACRNKVNVTANKAFNIGGVAGFVGEMGTMVSETNPMATVKDCVNEGSVSGNVRVGGIVGRNAGTVTGCVNYGSVFNASGQKKGTGGIVGMNGVNNAASDAGIIENCYNLGEVDCNKGFWTGGITGFNNGASIVKNSYNAGLLKTTAASETATTLYSWVNPIVGQNEGTVTNCLFRNTPTENSLTSYTGRDGTGVGNAGGTVTEVSSVTEDYLKSAQAAMTLGEDVWNIDPEGTISQGFIVLKWQGGAEAHVHTFGENGFCAGNDAYDPEATDYVVTTAEQLALIRDGVNGGDSFAGKTVTLDADIALAEDGLYTTVENVVYGTSNYPMTTTQYVLKEEAPVWTPIGSGSASNNTAAKADGAAFAGTFDGAGHTVSGVYTGTKDATKGNTDTVQGLFGIVSGTVKNVTVSGCITGKIVLGGVVAHLAGGTVENCTNNAVVFSDGGTTPGANTENGVKRGGAAGGIAGNVMTGSVVTGNINNAAVICANTSKGGRAGGIIGLIDGSGDTVTIHSNGNNGAIAAYQYAGGIIGMNASKASPIDRCYNTGHIDGYSSGSTYIGGITGQCASDITNCYNTGNYKITNAGKAAHDGGIVSDFSGTKIENCYNTGMCEAAGSSYGAICGSGYGSSANNKLVNCYALDSTIGEDIKNGCVTTLAEADMKAVGFMTRLNSGSGEAAYNMDVDALNQGYPVLKWQGGTDPTVWDGHTIDVSWYNTTDTEFHIQTPAQFMGLAAIVNGMYHSDITTVIGDDDHTKIVNNEVKFNASTGGVNDGHRGNDTFDGKTVYLDNDIDMGGVYDAETDTWSGARYMPVGGAYQLEPNDATTQLNSIWGGVLDGQGHVVKNIYASLSNTSWAESVGLVGRIGAHDSDDASMRPTGAAVKNIAVTGYIEGDRSIGGIVGKIGQTNGGGTIENCVSLARVVSHQKKGVGGICGASWNRGQINNCLNLGKVTGGSPAGGLVGGHEIKLTNSYNVGSAAAGVSGETAGGSYDNCYWLDTSATKAIGSGSVPATVQSRTEEQLKAADFLAEINGNGRGWVAYSADYALGQAMKDAGLEGYPIPRVFAGEDTATVTRISRSGSPKRSYVEGQKFNEGTLKIFAMYSDGTREQITDYTLTLDEEVFDKNTAFAQADDGKSLMISGTFGGQEYECGPYEIQVAASVPTEMTNTTSITNNLLFAEGDTVPYSTARAYVKFSNGTASWISLSSDENLTCNKTEPLTADDNGTELKLSYTLNDVSVERTIGTLEVVPAVEADENGVRQLSTVDDLRWFAAANSDSYRGTAGAVDGILRNDIDLSETAWTPICNINNGKTYSGTFDGNGHSMTLNITSGSNQGVFGYLNSGTVKNLTVEGTIAGSGQEGAIAAYVTGAATIDHCINKAAIRGANYLGGLVGNMTGAGTIVNSSNEAAITATGSAVGGLVGNANAGGSLTASSNTGAVQGTFNVGGLIGSSQIDIADCYNTGSVTATAGRNTQGAGGLVGMQSGAADRSIRNSYQTGAVSCTAETPAINVGAVLGYLNANNLTLDNVHYLEGTADEVVGKINGSRTVIGEAVSHTSEALQTEEMVAVLNADRPDTVFNMDETPALNQGYPLLAWQGGASLMNWKSVTWNGGLDFSWYDENDVKTEYHIQTPMQWEAIAWICSEDLALLSDYANNTAGNVTGILGDIPTKQNKFVGVQFYLDNDIDMGGVYDAESDTWSGPNYYPIGMSGRRDSGSGLMYSVFCGSFDGQAHMVKNVNCRRGTSMDDQNIGLFGRVGEPDSATGNAWSSDTYVDTQCDITIENIAVTGFIQGGRSVGGVVGKTLHVYTGHKVTVRNCVNFATVNSTQRKGLGGVCGAAWNGGFLENCANFGKVYGGGSPQGGLVGGNENTLKNSYNVGSVASNSGISGEAAGGTCENVYWLDTSASRAGGVSPASAAQSRTAEEMTSEAFVKELCGDGRAWVAYSEDYELGQFMKEAGFAGYPIPRTFAGEDTATVTKISRSGSPKQDYVEGQKYDAGTLSIFAVYSDGTKERITDYDILLEEESFDRSGTFAVADNGKTMLISGSYGGKDFECGPYEISVEANVPTEMTNATSITNNLLFAEGDTVPYSTARAYVKFSNGTASWISLSSDENLTCNRTEPLTADDNGTELKLIYTLNGVSVERTIGTLEVVPAVEADENGVRQLSTVDDLRWFAAANSDSYRETAGVVDGTLKNSIDVSEVTWTPICNVNNGKTYTGTFDGDGKTITLHITGGNNAGLFGYINTGTVKNVNVAGTIAGGSNTGAIAGNVTGAATIENCENRASVSGSASTGGVIGNLSGAATITKVVNQGSVSGTIPTGGLIGNASNGTLSQSFNAGSVEGNYNVGGLIGASRMASVTDCYNAGSVTAKMNAATGGAGGLIGTQTLAESTISSSYNAGAVTSTQEEPNLCMGSILGYQNANVTLDSVYALEGSAELAVGKANGGRTLTGEAVVKTSDELADSAMVSALNGEGGTVWAEDTIAMNSGYPVLNWAKEKKLASMASFKTHSLLLSGQIGVTFYMDLPGDASEYKDSYVEFTVNGETQTAAFDPNNQNSKKTYYGFTCYVNAVSMADEITAVYHNGSDTLEDSYSVVQYVDAFEQVKDNFDDKTVTLIESLADYGHYMQLFLSDSKGWKIGVDHQEMKGFTASYDLDAVKEALSDYAVVRETGESDLEKITYSLYLDAETSVYVYLKPNADYTGNLTVTVDGSEAEAELQKDGRYRVAIRDISAHRLGDTHTILATTDNGTATVKVSALSYADTLLNASAYANNTNARYAMAALYKYSEAAVAAKNA